MSQIPVVVQHAPHFTALEAEELARERYGLTGIAAALPSERDQNFRITCADGISYVLKIANTTEREEILDFQNAALAHLAGDRPATPAGSAAQPRTDEAVGEGSCLTLPRIIADASGGLIGRVSRAGGAEHMVRLLTWIPGRVLAATRPHSRALLISLGEALGEMDRAFTGFTHPAMNRVLQWDLARTSWTAAELGRFDRADRRAIVERVLERFDRHAAPLLSGLRRQVIHNDWNDYNVLVSDRLAADGRQATVNGRRLSVNATSAPGAAGEAPAWREMVPRVVGAVDFGDMLESWTVADLAVACAYAMLGKPDPIGAAAAIVEGYHRRLPLLEDELDVLLDLIRARLAISVTMAACQSAEAPDNEYLRISERLAWNLLTSLDAIEPAWATCTCRKACGLPASRTSIAVKTWLDAHHAEFGPVVAEDLRTSPLAVLDLAVGSLDIPNVAVVENIDRFCTLVNSQLEAAGVRCGIGRYDEARLVYVSELFRHVNNWDTENRTVHLGIDIFLPAGAEVRAPLDGVVHSCRNNRGAGDYGPTIILEHAVAHGLRFYTLYGHLSEDSLTGREPGQAVRKGEVIARLGGVDVNGGWPPHLHFQIITDMLGRSGDFPGVAAPSERAIWLDLCPDANLMLGIPDARFPAREATGEEIFATRRRHLGPNLSVSYRRPLTIVRGHMQYLFDADGRRFLDGVNNVPHVGHSHPRVVAAAARQLAVLNTNTRYLNAVLASYAERLAASMPDPLTVCFIVCSGSEANELALRLARAYTGRKGVVVVDGAYHGNTTSLVDISPYKFDGPGGSGRPPHVRKAVMPDVYRGPHKAADTQAGAKYAAAVAEAVRELGAEQGGVAAFFCESLLSCGGQIVLPDGYLQDSYAPVRAAGGLCVADEVQVGFGRVGSHLWGFETQGVTPDIVTLGKPIGNGFPLAAVVTRREIAEAFDNGMEYFNTFGGSQASCAVGHAVLDVMRDERLQERALSVGARLKSGLEGLKERFPLVGDVRGLGLFLGVELVSNRATLEPAAPQADYIVNRLRDRGILLSTDGPLHNVLKIKPPLQFAEADAERLVATLAEILEEDAAQP